MAKILVIDDERSIRFTLQHLLQQEGHLVQVDEDAENAGRTLEKTTFDVVICDINLPGLQGTDLMRLLQGSSPETAVILITGTPRMESIIDGIRGGAIDYLIKPVSRDRLLTAVNNASRKTAVSAFKRNLESENRYYQQALVTIEQDRNRDIDAITEKLLSDATQQDNSLCEKICQKALLPLQKALPADTTGPAEHLLASLHCLTSLLSPAADHPQCHKESGKAETSFLQVLADPENNLSYALSRFSDGFSADILQQIIWLLRLALFKYKKTGRISSSKTALNFTFFDLTASEFHNWPEHELLVTASKVASISISTAQDGQNTLLSIQYN